MASTTALRPVAPHPPTWLAHQQRLVPQPSNVCRRAAGSILTSVAPGAGVTVPFGTSVAASRAPPPPAPPRRPPLRRAPRARRPAPRPREPPAPASPPRRRCRRCPASSRRQRRPRRLASGAAVARRRRATSAGRLSSATGGSTAAPAAPALPPLLADPHAPASSANAAATERQQPTANGARWNPTRRLKRLWPPRQVADTLLAADLVDELGSHGQPDRGLRALAVLASRTATLRCQVGTGCGQRWSRRGAEQ